MEITELMATEADRALKAAKDQNRGLPRAERIPGKYLRALRTARDSSRAVQHHLPKALDAWSLVNRAAVASLEAVEGAGGE